MSRNISQIYGDNPTTTIPNGALIYLGLPPLGVSNDSAIKIEDIFTGTSVVNNQIAVMDGTSGKKIKNSTSIIDDNGKLSTDTINVANTSATAGGIQFGSANFISNYGTHNLFAGESSGNLTLTTGSAISNVGIGYLTLNAITTASSTTAVGASCLKLLTTGINNAAFGQNALGACTTGGGNAAFGKGALSGLTTGGSNIAIGPSAGNAYTGAETGNLIIGNSGTLGESNVIRIGSGQSECHIAGINGVSITNRAVVVVDTGVTDQLGSITILTSGNGGTGNGFTKFSGPASTEKTFTLPNASDTIACLGQANTFTKAQSVTPVAVTSSGGSIATDASLSNNFTHTMTENTTLANPTNLVNGTFYQWRFVQAASAKTLAFGSKFKFSGGSAMIISTGSGAVDILSAYYDSTSDTLDCTYAQAFA